MTTFELHDAVRRSDQTKLRELIALGSNVNEIDQHRRSPLHIAAWLANYDALLLLIRSKALTNLKAVDGFTPLHFVCQSNGALSDILACIKLLVKKDKSLLNQRVTKGNKSALHLSVAKNKVEVASILIELGADCNAKTSSGQLPIALAKTEEMRTVLKNAVELLQAKSDDKSDDEEELSKVAKQSEEVGDAKGSDIGMKRKRSAES